MVTNYLPVTEDKTTLETTKTATLCPEVKSEPMKHVKSVSEGNHALSEDFKPASNHKLLHENHVEGDHEPQPESHGERSKKGEEKVQEGSHKNILTESHENIPSKEEVHNTSTEEGHDTKISTQQKSTETLDNASILVPYKDIMKCIESLLKKTTPVQTESPLAYIVLNRPC